MWNAGDACAHDRDHQPRRIRKLLLGLSELVSQGRPTSHRSPPSPRTTASSSATTLASRRHVSVSPDAGPLIGATDPLKRHSAANGA